MKSKVKSMLAIVILNWNRAEETLECLKSVAAIRYPHFEIILVDNGSSEPLPEIPDSIRLLRNEENLGFAEGNNRGIAYAIERGAEYILLLNNDTSVDPEILNAFMEAAAQNPDAGVFGAKIYYYDEPTTLWYAGGDVDLKRGRCYHVGCTKSDLDKRWETIQETGYACGCALMVKTEVVQKVGLMDADFFLLWEEIDWCWRIRKAGYKCLFVPKARVWHKISTSFEGGNRGAHWQYFYWRNRLLFLKRHHPFFFLQRTFWLELAHLLLSYPFLPASTKTLHRAALSGIRDYYRNALGPKT
jgi:GT2 family glycosyltransferase